MRIRIAIFAIIYLLTVAPVAIADTLWLKDGSQLTGTVKSVTTEAIIFDTQFLGETTVPLDALQGITTAKELSFGTQSGTPDYRDGQQLLIVDGSATPVSNEALSTLTDPAVIATTTPAPEIVPTPEWSGRIELGMNGATGNSENFAFLGKADATRESDARLIYLYFQADYQEKNGDRTENEFLAGLRYEWVLNDRLNAYTKLELEHDEFEDLDLRATLTGGLAYSIIESDRQDLVTRGGIGYQREDFDDGSSQDQAVFDLGYDYRLDIRKQFRLTHKLAYLSVVDDPLHDFRIVVDTAGEVPLNKEETWKLRLGVNNEYDNDPQSGVDHTDTKYYLNLAYDW